MATKTAPKPTTTPASVVEIDHCVCNCQIGKTPMFAYCGLDVSDEPWIEWPSKPCAVCLDLMFKPCERCGEE